MLWAMDRTEFERIVQETVDGLPPQFADAVKDVIILIKDRPHPRRHRTHSRRAGGLLGLYDGVPITEWDADHNAKLPDTITLFQKNMEEYAVDETEVPHVIRETLLHEIAHHFGFEHDVIDEMEKKWLEKREETQE